MSAIIVPVVVVVLCFAFYVFSVKNAQQIKHEFFDTCDVVKAEARAKNAKAEPETKTVAPAPLQADDSSLIPFENPVVEAVLPAAPAIEETEEVQVEEPFVAERFDLIPVTGGRVILAYHSNPQRVQVRVAKNRVRETLGFATNEAELFELMAKACDWKAYGVVSKSEFDPDVWEVNSSIADKHAIHPLTNGYAIVSEYPNNRLRVRVIKDDVRAEIGWATTENQLTALLLEAESFQLQTEGILNVY